MQNQIDAALCRTCLYKTFLTGVGYKKPCCGYLYYTGKPRNSEPSNCNKYKKYTKKARAQLLNKFKQIDLTNSI